MRQILNLRTGLLLTGLVMSAQAVAAVPGRPPAAIAWTGTWMTAMSQLPQPAQSSLSFANQTYRQIIHTSIGGSSARIHISNLFGTVPLRIGAAHIARAVQPGIPQTIAGTDVQVTFHGAKTVSIPAGQEITSDSIAFPVAALSDVAISIFFTNTSAVTMATGNQFAQSNHFWASGDATAVVNYAAAGSTNQYFFLTGLDVVPDPTAGAVVAFGASIVSGNQSGDDTNQRWTDVLAQRLNAVGLNVGVLNAGIAGNEALQDNGPFGPEGLDRLGRDVFSRPGVKYMILGDLMINDLSGGKSVGQVTAATQSIVTQAHQHGIPVMCATQTPFEGADGYTEEINTEREQYNAFLRGSPAPCDALIDQDAVLRDPNDLNEIAPNLSSPDHEHPNANGYRDLGEAIDLAFFNNNVPVPPPPPLVADGTYVLVSRLGGLVLDDPGFSADPGTVMDIWDANGGNNQQWQLTNSGNNRVALLNVASGLALDVAGGSTADAAAVVQNPYINSLSQQWRLDSVGNGFFKLTNAASGEALDVSGGVSFDGATLDQFPYKGSSNQQWSFTSAGGSAAR